MRAKIIKLEEVNSTNDYLKERCETLPNFSLVHAKKQTAGRGRFNRKWISEEGGLWFSILIRHKRPDKSFLLCFAAAATIVEVLEKVGVVAEVKWPNDVYVGEKKICGILTENVIFGELANTIIGIGLNVNNPVPLEKTTTIKKERVLDHNIDKILRTFVRSYKKRMRAFSKKNHSAILKDWARFWKERGTFVKRKTVKGIVQGDVLGIDGEGQLILMDCSEKVIVNEGDVV